MTIKRYQIEQSRCPECGARIHVHPTRMTAHCDYCHHEVQISETETSAEELKQQGNATFNSDHPEQRIIGELTTVAIWLPFIIKASLFVFILLPLLVWAGNFGYQIYRSRTAEKTATQTAADVPPSNIGPIRWFASYPMLKDITNDGVLDVIGLGNLMGESKKRLVAFDPNTGKNLWTSIPTQTEEVALVDDKILVGTPSGVLLGFQVENGVAVWQIPLGEVVKKICHERPGSALVQLKDDRIIQVNLTTGQLTERGYSKEVAPCGPVQTKTFPDTIGVYSRMLNHYPTLYRMSVPNLSTQVLVTRIADGTQIAIGKQKEGSPIPMAVRLPSNAANASNTPLVPLWTTGITTLNPLRTRLPMTGTAAAIAAGRVIIGYESLDSPKGYRISSIDIQTGRILWDTPLPPNPSANPSAPLPRILCINISNRYIFVSTTHGLYIFQLADGRYRLTI